jgi:tetratricopeptide (TPR) repeat protein
MGYIRINVARTVAVVVAVGLATACASPKMVEIRPLGARSTAAAPASSRVAEGRARLVLGDAGLALESFRRALAEDPQSVAALQGMAACYELMGRYDLSRRYYEQALATAPHDRETLGALASSLASQGLDQQAAAVRGALFAERAGIAALRSGDTANGTRLIIDASSFKDASWHTWNALEVIGDMARNWPDADADRRGCSLCPDGAISGQGKHLRSAPSQSANRSTRMKGAMTRFQREGYEP